MKQNNAVRVLSADVFDALEMSALAFEGIGKDHYSNERSSTLDLRAGELEPCCIHGHEMLLDGPDWAGKDGPVDDSLYAIGIGTADNDFAVNGDERISFAEWCKRLNVVRADEPTFDPAHFPTKRR